MTTQLLNINTEETGIVKIAFGSCYGIWDYTNDIFRVVNENNPHLWVWMGDAAYTDKVEDFICKTQIIFHLC